MTYYVIQNRGGDTHVCPMDEGELVETLTPNRHGDAVFDFSKALTHITAQDTNYWGDGFLIIKGEIVVPRAEEVVTRIVV